MANTVMAAKNSFQKGLIMDFNPSDTQADCLTSALNATLLTFNGNEMALQNDMGNGRIETAYLPEGFMPVGTCEYGDIIYIVSYNPLTNQSQIGCFPSPERNLSSEELEDLSITLSDNDFRINNKLTNLSSKKILISSKDLNPGDKYLVSAEQLNNLNKDYVKLSVVSIESNGNITKLNTEVHNYDTLNKLNNGKIDIDSYRTLLKSGWGIFSSKVSGKLAILAELIVPEIFSCTYSIDVEGDDYVVYLEPDCGDFKTEYICVTESNSKDRIIFAQSDIDNSETDIDNSENPDWIASYNDKIKLCTVPMKNKDFVYSFKVSPARPFGRIESLEIPLSINFASIDSGDINLTHWKYHNSEQVVTLQYGIETYLRPNEIINETTIEFFDDKGIVGVYKSNRKSYNGIITDYIGLDGNKVNSRFSNKDTNGEIILHPGPPFEGTDTEYTEYLESNGISGIVFNGIKHTNDSGVLYSNFLYLARITVKIGTGPDKPNEVKRSQIFYRWLWTNSMFNQYFYKYDDYKELKCELVLDNLLILESNDNYIWNEKLIDNLNKDITQGKHNSYSANVQYIGMNNENPNINMYIDAKLENNYGCFTIPKNILQQINIVFNTDLENEITYSKVSKDFSYKEVPISESNYLQIQDKEFKNNNNDIFKHIREENPVPINTAEITLQDMFNLNIQGLDENNTIPLLNCYFSEYDFEKYQIIRNANTELKAKLDATIYNKAYAEDDIQEASTMAVYSPIINSLDEAQRLGIFGTVKNNNQVKLGLQAINLDQVTWDSNGGGLFGSKLYLNTGDITFTDVELGWNKGDVEAKIEPDYIYSQKRDVKTDNQFREQIWDKICNGLGTFFNIYFLAHNTEQDCIGVTNSTGLTKVSEYWRDNLRPFIRQTGYYTGPYQLMCVPVYDDDNDYPTVWENGIRVYRQEAAPVPILGVKYKESLTALNCAYVEKVNNWGDTVILQEAYTKNKKLFTEYCNFASQLYLLFTRIYHKNKAEPDVLVPMKNFVKNTDYVTTLTKHIITTIKYSGTKSDILLKGLSLSSFVNDTISKGSIQNLPPNTEIENIVQDNTVVVFQESAKDNVLTINIENKPIEFPDIDKQAQFLYNGKGYLCTEISDSNFYIMKDNTLKKYKDEELFFTEQEISDSLKYIFGTSEGTGQYSLYNCIPKQQDNNKGASYKYLKEQFDKWISQVIQNTMSIGSYYLDPDAYCQLGPQFYSDMINFNVSSSDYLSWDKFCEYLQDPSKFNNGGYIKVNYTYKSGLDSDIYDIYQLFYKIVTYVIFKTGKIYLKESREFDSRKFDITTTSFSSQIQYIKDYCLQNYEYAFDQDIESFILREIDYNIYGDQWYGNKNQNVIPSDAFGGQYVVGNLNTTIQGGKDSKISFIPKMDLNNSFKYDGELSVNTSQNHSYYGIIADPQRGGFGLNRGLYGFIKDLSIDTNYQIL